MADENGTKRKLSDDENGEQESVKKVKSAGKEAGTLLFSGLTQYEDRNNLGPKTETIKWSPIRYESLEGVRIRDVSSGPVSFFFLAISDEGKLYACGLNEKGQLGLGDFQSRRNPTLVERMENMNVVAVATGRQHSLILTDEGDVFSCGNNSCGQCGVGLKKDMINSPTKIDYAGPPIKQVACGDNFSLILNEAGDVFSFGSPEHGQLGLGSEQKEIAGRKEVFTYSYTPTLIGAYIEVDDGEVVSHGQPKIVYIAAGITHSCAIDDQQRCFTWGFGGYGRLGHNDTRNELLPRLMRCWFRITGRADGGVTKVSLGGQFNLVQTIIDKCMYMFGQFHRNAEANMYPKFLDDLQGWNVRDVSCSQQGFLICADDCVIGSQPSPGYGQLGMGDKVKSSAAPKILTSLKNVYCLRTGLGYCHSVFIIRDKTDKDKEAIEKFPAVSFEDFKAMKNDKADDKKKGAKAKPKPKKKVK